VSILNFLMMPVG